jgi:hypothetical protein
MHIHYDKIVMNVFRSIKNIRSEFAWGGLRFRQVVGLVKKLMARDSFGIGLLLARLLMDRVINKLAR